MLGSFVVLPSNVADLQEKLFNDVAALDRDVQAAGVLSAAQRATWAGFMGDFERWYNVDPYSFSSYWTAGTLYDQGVQLEQTLASWQATLAKLGARLTEPTFAPPSTGLDWSALKVIAVCAAVIAGAVVAFPVSRELHALFAGSRRSRGSRRR